ncbi:MAG: aldo/keto reductase [Candidatus Methanomethylophilaceae archaeon]|nr:aldo/keto reductase [Candidatus Methanomethylophilaceae archaeon]
MDHAELNTGKKMPLLGFGVFQIPDAKECEDVVYTAIKNGYRLIDTAAAYVNEEAVGKAIERAVKDGLVTRDELFVTTKVWVQDMREPGQAFESVKVSLKKLGLDRLDLVLLHQPMGDYFTAYRDLIKANREGLTDSIGVSNFYPAILANMCESTDVIPAVNQVELHPFFAQEGALENMKRYGVVPQAWGPLAEGKHGLFTHPVLSEIGAKYGKTPAQVALRWNVDRGVSVLPKSVHEDRIRQNIDIFDFKLDKDDMDRISKLDLGRSEIVDHSSPDFVRFVLGWRVPR